MSGRRSHPRFAVADAWEGTLRVVREVVVDRREGSEFLAVSHMAGVVGEEMSLGLLGGGEALGLRVRVVESRPVVIDGAVRHRLRLSIVSSEAAVDGAAATEGF